MKDCRLIKAIPESRLHRISGDGEPPSVRDLGQTDQWYSTQGGQMVEVYFVSVDSTSEWLAEAYETEIGIGIEPGTTNEELIRRFGQPQKRDLDGRWWIYHRSTTKTSFIVFNDDYTVHETRFDCSGSSST